MSYMYIPSTSLQLIELVHLCIVVDDGPDDFVFEEPPNLLLSYKIKELRRSIALGIYNPNRDS